MILDEGKSVETCPRASIIIPACNEAPVIGRCLEELLRDTLPGMFDVVVVCNGCSDNTAEIARRAGDCVNVYEIELASKTNALNFGDSVARVFPRIYLDADLEISAAAVQALVDGLEAEKYHAAVGFMDIELEDRPWTVRQFYSLWSMHPYLDRGKFGGIYALDETGWQMRGSYPSVIADDAFARMTFRQDEYAAVETCRFRMFPPMTLRDTIKIRTRAYLGNIQLNKLSLKAANRGERGNALGWLARVSECPHTWLGLPVYIFVNLVAKLRAARLYRRTQFEWLRDETSRRKDACGDVT